jgi:hypothetical protein
VILEISWFGRASAVFVGDPPIWSRRAIVAAPVRSQLTCRPRRSTQRLIRLVALGNRILRASVNRHVMLL